jgi:hypothetical protein
MERGNMQLSVINTVRTQGQDATTQEIIDQLRLWNQHYGVVLLEAGSVGLTIRFESLPSELDELVEEIEDICPELYAGNRELALLRQNLRERPVVRLEWR